jgi:formate C-acetyltransferase
MRSRRQHGFRGQHALLCRMESRLAPGGAGINLRLSPGYFPAETGPDILASLLKTYMALGGEQIQVNMVSTETLRRSLQTPGDYRDLVVRVAGFTVYFVSLTPELQQELLSRAEG